MSRTLSSCHLVILSFMSSANTSTNTPPRRLVVKLGTNVLTAGTDHLHRPRMVELIRQIAEARAHGTEVVLVSSGAVAAGRERLQFPPRRKDLPIKQLMAAVG